SLILQASSRRREEQKGTRKLVGRADARLHTRIRRRIHFQGRLGHEGLSLLHLSGFALAFLIAYTYAMNLSQRSGAPFWLPDSVLLCALILSRPGTWAIYLATTLPLRLTFAVPPGTPVWFLLAAFANDSLKALAAAVLLRRVLRGRTIRFDRL